MRRVQVRLRKRATTVLAVAVLFAGLSGCATPPPASPAPPVVNPAPAPANEAREVAFACDNGETLRVRFSQAPAQAVLLRGGDEVVLPQEPSGSGFRYGTPRASIRGKGDALTVEIGRMVPLQCTAVR